MDRPDNSQKLEEIIPHSQAEVREIFNREDYSGFEDYGDFKLLGLRRLVVAQEDLSFSSQTYIIRTGDVFLLDRETERFSKSPQGMAGLLQSLEDLYNENRRILDTYANTIESLEDNLFSRSIPGYFLDLWFDIKKDLARIENYYFRNYAVYREFYKKTESQFGDLTDDFKDVEEGIQFQNKGITSLSQRLESLHGYHSSIKADRLNKTLLMLTVISGIFLPLNLIVGFFGMNTENMLFHGDPKGTENVMFVLLGVFVLCSLGLRIIKTIDHYFLKFLLGRYNFYKNLTARLNEFDDRLKGH